MDEHSMQDRYDFYDNALWVADIQARFDMPDSEI
jgi:hypothetical protein